MRCVQYVKSDSAGCVFRCGINYNQDGNNVVMCNNKDTAGDLLKASVCLHVAHLFNMVQG